MSENNFESNLGKIQKPDDFPNDKLEVRNQIIEAVRPILAEENAGEDIEILALDKLRPIMKEIKTFTDLSQLYQNADSIEAAVLENQSENIAPGRIAETIKYLISLYSDKLMRSQKIDENTAQEIAKLHNTIVEAESALVTDNTAGRLEKDFSVLFPMENQMQLLRRHGTGTFKAYKEQLGAKKMIDKYLGHFFYYWCRQGKEHWVEARLETKTELEMPDYLHIFSLDKEYSAEKIIQFIAGQKADNDQMKLAIITLTDLLSAEQTRQKLNELIVENRKTKNQAAITNLEYARSFITPNHDKIAMASVAELYKKINFKAYGLNEKMNSQEVELLKSLIKKDEQVLEMGCGAGRLLLEMKKAGYDVTGYDLTDDHPKSIKEDDKTAKVFRGDWHNNGLKDQSCNTVYSLGRNILHDYALADQVQLFREAARILKPGGRLIFDIPDREKGGFKQMADGYGQAMREQKVRELKEEQKHSAGGYKQAVLDYQTEMEKRGVRNFRQGTIYDSPDGINFMTRYAYSRQDILDLAKLAGFRIVKVEERNLETGQGDVNLYYVLEKTIG